MGVAAAALFGWLVRDYLYTMLAAGSTVGRDGRDGRRENGEERFYPAPPRPSGGIYRRRCVLPNVKRSTGRRRCPTSPEVRISGWFFSARDLYAGGVSRARRTAAAAAAAVATLF